MSLACGILILDCPACPDPARAGQPWRQADGLREWVAEFRDGEIVDPALANCPDCGAPGCVYAY